MTDWHGGLNGYHDESGEWRANLNYPSWTFRSYQVPGLSLRVYGEPRGRRTLFRRYTVEYTLGGGTWSESGSCDSLACAKRRAWARFQSELPAAMRTAWDLRTAVYRFDGTWAHIADVVCTYDQPLPMGIYAYDAERVHYEHREYGCIHGSSHPFAGVPELRPT